MEKAQNQINANRQNEIQKKKKKRQNKKNVRNFGGELVKLLSDMVREKTMKPEYFTFKAEYESYKEKTGGNVRNWEAEQRIVFRDGKAIKLNADEFLKLEKEKKELEIKNNNNKKFIMEQKGGTSKQENAN